VLFDVLSLVADHSQQAQSYRRGAADLLRFGLSAALAELAIEAADYLRTPPGGASAAATRKFALNGALIAVYLLDLAERQKEADGEHAVTPAAAVLPTGLSLLGLTLLGFSAQRP
jgi:hypothetical protein